MLDAARKAVAFLGGCTVSTLQEDEKLALALVRLIEVIGEAAKAVTVSTREANPDLPWREMAGARDRLIHGYYDVDLDQVWAIVVQDLPLLVARLEAMLAGGPDE